jgi:hypothetical protein
MGSGKNGRQEKTSTVVEGEIPERQDLEARSGDTTVKTVPSQGSLEGVQMYKTGKAGCRAEDASAVCVTCTD